MSFVASGPGDVDDEDRDSSAKMDDACLLAVWCWVVECNRQLAVKADAVDSAVDSAAATAIVSFNRLPIMMLLGSQIY
jgi:hypothetical protein